MLTDDARRLLVELARISVRARVAGERVALSPLSAFPAASGVFVTVKVDGELRGCLGTLESDDLGRDVARCAADAASQDPRFPPIVAAELSSLTVDISVLGPLERIDPGDPASFTVGEHGLVVEAGEHRGLLLPQVARERRWTRAQFLGQTCLKAGLRADAWQTGATVYRFTADVFGGD